MNLITAELAMHLQLFVNTKMNSACLSKRQFIVSNQVQVRKIRITHRNCNQLNKVSFSKLGCHSKSSNF